MEEKGGFGRFAEKQLPTFIKMHEYVIKKNERRKKKKVDKALKKMAGDNLFSRWKGARSLLRAVKNPITRRGILKIVMKKLSSDEINEKRWAAAFLGLAAHNGVDTSLAIPKLKEMTSDKNIDVARNAISVLKSSAHLSKNRKELIWILRRVKGSPEAKETAKKKYEEWMEKQNKRIKIRIDKKMKKPERKPNKERMKRII